MAIKLSALWIASFAAVALADFVAKEKEIIATGEYIHPGPLGSIPLFEFFIITFYLFPLLLTALHFAKTAKIKVIVIIGRILLFVYAIWIPFALLTIVLTALGILT